MKSQPERRPLSEMANEPTIDVVSEAPKPLPAPGDATCEIQPEDKALLTAPAALPLAPAGDATCDLAAAPPGGATCDFQPEVTQPTNVGRVNQTVERAHPKLSPPTGTLDVTGEFQAGTAANPAEGGVTRDFDPGSASESSARKTSLRSRGDLTQPAQPGGPTTLPQDAGRYVFKKFHAKGGMGEVWLAEDSDIGRPVALKRMLKGRESHRLAFLKEAQVTGQLEHPGVIPVHELGHDENGQPFYVMKFIAGQTLKEVTKEYHRGGDSATPREVQWLRLLNIFVNLCQTIAYAHSRGVIHRDIKPDNVMVGAYGETLVLDWGLAKVVGEPDSDDPYAAVRHSSQDDASQASITGSIKGTPFYFAPEVAFGSVEDVDQVSDVYLLGATLYYMVANRPPREGKKVSEVLDDARMNQPKALRQIDANVSRPLDAICRKAMAYKKEDRYATATALADDVQRYLAGEPVSAYQENWYERSWRWVKKHRTALSRAAVFAVVLGIGLTALFLVLDAERRRAADVLAEQIKRDEDVKAEQIKRQEEVNAEKLKRDRAEANAAVLKRQDEARGQIAKFRNLADEARFFAASANPVAEFVPALDAAQAEARATEALQVAGTWGPRLEQMPLEAERAGLRKEMYDFLLEFAELKSRRAAPEAVKEAETYLEQAASFQTPTQSFYRVRARCLEARGEQEWATLDLKRAADPNTPTTAMDDYLLGEQERVESLKPVQEDIQQGKQAGIKRLLARRDLLNKAVESYRRAVRRDPNHYWAHFQLGSCYSGLGAFAEAAEALGSCIVLQPAAPWGFSSRGLALAQLAGRQSDALADLNHALKLKADFQPARLHRAVFYAKQEQYAEAERDFEILLATPADKRLAQTLLSRGQMYLERAMYDQALADLEQFVATPAGKQHTFVYLLLTRVDLVRKMPDRALDYLSQFLALGDKRFDPKSPRAFEQRGRELRLLAGEFNKPEARSRQLATYLLALSELEKAVKLGRETASLFDELGSTQEKLAELEPKKAAHWLKASLAAYDKGIELAPKERKLLLKRGWALVNYFEAYDKAKKDFSVVIATAPGEAEAYAGLGYAEAMLKAPAAARRHANLATLYGAGDYLILHNAACIFAALSKTELPQSREYQDLTLDHLQRAVELWEKGGKVGPDEINLIRLESAFPAALKARPEFKKLIEEKS